MVWVNPFSTSGSRSMWLPVAKTPFPAARRSRPSFASVSMALRTVCRVAAYSSAGSFSEGSAVHFFLPGAEILQRLGGVGRSLLHGLIDGQPLHNAVQEAGDIAVARAHAVHKVFTGNDAEFMELASVVA